MRALRDGMVTATYSMTYREAMGAHANERHEACMLTLANTMRSLAARKGRELVMPTLQFEQHQVLSAAVDVIIAKAETATGLWWKKSEANMNDTKDMDAKIQAALKARWPGEVQGNAAIQGPAEMVGLDATLEAWDRLRAPTEATWRIDEAMGMPDYIRGDK